MLRKMYLVSPEYLNKSKLQSTSVSPKIRNTKKQNKRLKTKKTHHPYDRRFEMRNEMREADDNRKALLRMIADFVQKLLQAKHLHIVPRSISVINTLHL